MNRSENEPDKETDKRERSSLKKVRKGRNEQSQKARETQKVTVGRGEHVKLSCRVH